MQILGNAFGQGDPYYLTNEEVLLLLRKHEQFINVQAEKRGAIPSKG